MDTQNELGFVEFEQYQYWEVTKLLDAFIEQQIRYEICKDLMPE
jgi:hypothetical protein